MEFGLETHSPYEQILADDQKTLQLFSQLTAILDEHIAHKLITDLPHPSEHTSPTELLQHLEDILEASLLIFPASRKLHIDD